MLTHEALLRRRAAAGNTAALKTHLRKRAHTTDVCIDVALARQKEVVGLVVAEAQFFLCKLTYALQRRQMEIVLEFKLGLHAS